MQTFYFFLGCALFFGIPALITYVIASNEQEKLSAKIKNDFCKQFDC